MTVEELRSLLATLPPNAPVTFRTGAILLHKVTEVGTTTAICTRDNIWSLDNCTPPRHAIGDPFEAVVLS